MKTTHKCKKPDCECNKEDYCIAERRRKADAEVDLRKRLNGEKKSI